MRHMCTCTHVHARVLAAAAERAVSAGGPLTRGCNLTHCASHSKAYQGLSGLSALQVPWGRWHGQLPMRPSRPSSTPTPKTAEPG